MSCFLPITSVHPSLACVHLQVSFGAWTSCKNTLAHPFSRMKQLWFMLKYCVLKSYLLNNYLDEDTVLSLPASEIHCALIRSSVWENSSCCHLKTTQSANWLPINSPSSSQPRLLLSAGLYLSTSSSSSCVVSSSPSFLFAMTGGKLETTKFFYQKL